MIVTGLQVNGLLSTEQVSTLKSFLEGHHNSTTRFKWFEYLWNRYPSFRTSRGEPERISNRRRRHNCYVTLTSLDELLIHFNDESGEYGNIQQVQLDNLEDVFGYEYVDEDVDDGNVGKKIKIIKSKKLKTKKTDVCKKTSMCACKGVRCLVKPRCRGITKCSRGKKYRK